MRERIAGILRDAPTLSLERLLGDTASLRAGDENLAEDAIRAWRSARRLMEALGVFDRPVPDTAGLFAAPFRPEWTCRRIAQRSCATCFVTASRATGCMRSTRSTARRAIGLAAATMMNRRREYYAEMRKPTSSGRR